MLILRVGAMGDVLHALPAVTALRRLKPHISLDWVVDPRWAPLLAEAGGGSPIVSRLHLADTRLWSRAPWSAATRRSVLHLRQNLRQAHYNSAVDMQGTLRSAVLGRLAAARNFAGYADPRERPARWLYSRPLPRTGRHVVEQGAALLGQALGLTLRPARHVDLPRIPAAERWAEGTLATLAPHGRFALLAPTAGWGAKQWPAERFGALAAALQREGLAVLVNAAHEADPVALAAVAASRGAARIVTGGGNTGGTGNPGGIGGPGSIGGPGGIAGLIALTRRAALVVGGDSGPTHLAAALGTPLLALFGPTDPERNGPWGAGPMRILRDPRSKTTYKRTPEPEAGLAHMAVETVLRATLDVLSEAGAPQPFGPAPVPLQE